MSDLQELISGLKPQSSAAPQETPSRKPPKPDWVKRREEVTGIEANYNPDEKRWVFPGLSTNMGGPKAGTSKTEEQTPEATDYREEVRKAFTTGDYAGAVKILESQKDLSLDMKLVLQVAKDRVKKG